MSPNFLSTTFFRFTKKSVNGGKESGYRHSGKGRLRTDERERRGQPQGPKRRQITLNIGHIEIRFYLPVMCALSVDAARLRLTHGTSL